MDSALFKLATKHGDGGGEMDFCKRDLSNGESCNLSHVIATEILDTILDNVFTKTCPITISVEKSSEKITTVVVSDILEGILSRPSNVEASLSLADETILLDEEIKKIIKEMKSPPEVVTSSKQGVGDQIADKELVMPKPSKKFLVEKKARFTNLVRNSKNTLTRYMTGNMERGRSDDWEEKIEGLVKVTDLNKPSTLPPETSSSEDINESMMDVIDLNISKADEVGVAITESSSHTIEKKPSPIEMKRRPKKKWLKLLFFWRRNPK